MLNDDMMTFVVFNEINNILIYLSPFNLVSSKYEIKYPSICYYYPSSNSG